MTRIILIVLLALSLGGGFVGGGWSPLGLNLLVLVILLLTGNLR